MAMSPNQVEVVAHVRNVNAIGSFYSKVFWVEPNMGETPQDAWFRTYGPHYELGHFIEIDRKRCVDERFHSR